LLQLGGVPSARREEVEMAGARNISYLFSRLHDAFSVGGVTPPRLEINRRTIEKTWKLMDKAGCCQLV
jgi:hypothetical protein